MNTWDDVVFRFDIVTFTREELRKERGKICKRKSCQVVKNHVYYSNKDRAKHIALSIEGKYVTYIYGTYIEIL